MALPTPTKTWEFDVNHAPITTTPELMFQMKNKLVGDGATAFSNPPTVKSSSDSVTADNTDRWLDAGDVVFEEPAGAHSWIVFSCDAVQPGLEVCWSCEDTSGGNPQAWEIFYSDAAGFTGGTTTARPTATDEVVSYTGGSAAEIDGFSALATHPARLHVAQSSDGEVLRIWAYTDGVLLGWWELFRPGSPASVWTQPWVGNNYWYKYNTGANAPQLTYAKLALTVANYSVSYAAGQTSWMKYTSEATGVAEEMIPLAQDNPPNLQAADSWTLSGMGLYGVTAGAVGPAGSAVDMWWAPYRVPDGTHFPSDGSREFVTIDNVVIPWPGGAQMAMV